MTLSPWITRRRVLITGAVLATNLLTLTGYHLVVGSGPSVRVGIIDVAEVSAARRGEYLRRLVDSNDNKDKVSGTEHYVEESEKKLTEAMLQIERECACVLLTRTSVVWSAGMRDYTNRLIEVIGKIEG